MEDNDNLVTISNRTLCSFVKVQNNSRIVCAVLCSVSDCLSYQQKYMTVQKFQMREIGKKSENAENTQEVWQHRWKGY